MSIETDQRIQVVTFERDLSCLKYETDHGAPNFHACFHDYRADLLIKVIDSNDELQGCIPCDKVLIVKYFDQIAAKYKEESGTLWKKEEKQGISVYELKVDVEPQIVCDFIKSIYDGKVEFSRSCGIAFHMLSTFLLCGKLENHAQEYVAKNVENDNLVDTWYRDDSFQEACIDFVKSEEFDSEKLLENVGKLPLEKFTEFLNKASEPLTSSVLIGLKRNWLKANPNRESYENMIFKVDFSGISDKDKFKFYLEVIKDMDGDLVKRVSEHMFPSGSKDLNPDGEMITLIKCFEPTDEKLDQILNDAEVVNTKIKASVKELKKQREMDRQLKNEQTGQYNTFVEGTCIFDDRTAQSSQNFSNSVRAVFSKPVDLSVDMMTWKVRMDALNYHDGYTCKYFGVVKEDADGRTHGQGYMWAHNYSGHREQIIANKCIDNGGFADFGNRTLMEGDVLEIKLDQLNHRLEYFINGESQGIAFDNLPVQKYKLGITLGTHYDKVTLLDE